MSPDHEVSSIRPRLRRVGEGLAGAASRMKGGRRLPSIPLLSPLIGPILVLNLFALAALLAGILFLGQYRQSLIETEFDALQAQAALIASALGEGSVVPESEGTLRLSPALAEPMLERLAGAGQAQARIRLFDLQGRLLVDSETAGTQASTIDVETLPPPQWEWLLQAAARIDQWVDRHVLGRAPTRDLPDLSGAEPAPPVASALQGEGSRRLYRGDQGLVLVVTQPVQGFRQVLGAVMVTVPGETIAQAMAEIRGAILQVFLVVLVITVGFSIYLASSLARPIRRLATGADAVRRSLSTADQLPDFSARRDEIGDLSKALRAMTAALWQRIEATERFAADVAHEIKNPLSSIRSAIETLGRVSDPEKQARLLAVMHHDVQRLDRLITEISAVSRLDAELARARASPLDLTGLMQRLVRARQERETAQREILAGRGAESPGLSFALEGEMDRSWWISGVRSHLIQVFDNLLENAESFSPPGGTVTVKLASIEGDSAGQRAGASSEPVPAEAIQVMIEDQGPGIPDSARERIFERFYSQRPKAEAFGEHSGLGLAIARQIIVAHDGTIEGYNHHDPRGLVRGACFIVTLPLLDKGDGGTEDAEALSAQAGDDDA